MLRPASTRGRVPPDGVRLLLVLLLPLAVAVVACDSFSATGSPAAPSLAASPNGSGATPTAASPAADTSSEPPTPDRSTGPDPSAGASPGGSAGSGAAACSGSEENRDFYASMAAAVDWPVYCPVLADGWFVQDGQYRLADGGRLEIEYRGPDRARITIQGGAFCTISGGCVPPGVDVGPAAFGDRQGTLVALDDGSWAIVVDREAAFGWLLVVTGLDETATKAVAARMVLVGD